MTTFNGLSEAQAQKITLAGAAISATYYAAKNIAKTFLGSDSLSTREKNWTSASFQTGYLAAAGKRIQYFLGSDSLPQRLSNLFKSILQISGSIILFNLVERSTKAQEQMNNLNSQVELYGQASREAKEIAGKYIEACWQENTNSSHVELIKCIAQAIPGIFANLTTLTQDLALCNTSHTNCQQNINFLTAQKNLQESQLSELNTNYKAYQLQCENQAQSCAVNITDLNTQLATLSSENSRLNQELSHARQSLEIEKGNLNQQIAAVKEQLINSQAEMTQAGESNTALQEEIHNLKGLLKTLKEELAKKTTTDVSKKV